jgi:alginate O-acetyltransferase complex protein AlgI
VLFNSFLFVLFFAAVFLLHWVLPHRARNLLLLVASYVFYATWDWRFLGLIWLSTLLDYALALAIAGSTSARTRRLCVTASVVANLSLLGFFKYYGFFVESLDVLLAPLGVSAAGLHLDLVLPLGISFYTFQTMGYTIDVYRGHVEPVRRLDTFALYVCFFPQLVAGPIERAAHLVPQIRNPRRITFAHLQEGLFLAVWGFFKKVVVADNLARVVDPVFARESGVGGMDVVVATLAFTFQLYADFSAYTDIARGTARMLGFDLMRNFRMPYFARDIGDLWRRWHVSFTAWMRDYVFVSLGGSRGGGARVAFNLFLTLFLAGIWHGSDGTMFLFGAWSGLCVVAARWYRQRRPPSESRSWVPGALVSTLLFAIGLVPFRAQTSSQCLAFLTAIVTDLHWHSEALEPLLLVILLASPLLVFDWLQQRAKTDLFALHWPAAARAAVYLVVFYSIALYGRSDAVEFVYFQF